MGNLTRSIPRKALYSKDSSLVSILLYDKKFPIMSIIGNRPERGKLLIFQDSKKGGREAENGCLTPLQWISNFRGHPYSHSRNPLQWISKLNESPLQWISNFHEHHLNTSPAIQHYLTLTDANTAASNTTHANT